MRNLLSVLTRQKRIFYSFLFSYIFVLMIPLLFGVFIFQKSFSAVRSETESAYMNVLDQTRTTVDGRVSEIKKVAATFLMNEHVRSNMSIVGVPTPLQRLEFSILQKELNTFKASYPLIKDIDLYFPNGDFVLGNRSRYKSSDLPDMANTYYHMDMNTWKKLSEGVFYQKFVSIPNGQGGNDLLYLMTLDNSPKEKHSAVLMITLNGRTILSGLADQYKKPDGDIFLAWENGDVLDARYLSVPDDKSSAINYASILGKESVFKTSMIDDPVSVLHIPSSVAAFEYILVIKLSTFYQNASNMLTTIYFYIAICLVTGIAVSLKFSKNSYDPIDRIIRMIPVAKRNEPEINMFSSLETSLGKLFQQQKQLEDTLKRQRNDIRNAFLSNIVKGELEYSKRNFAEAVSLNIMLDKDDCYCVSVFAIADYGAYFAPTGEADDKSIDLAEYSVQNIIEELVSTCHKCYVFTCEGSVVCIAASKTSDHFEEDIMSAASTAIDFFSQKLLVTVAAAVSHASFGEHSIPNLYLEAENLLDYKRLLNTTDKRVSALNHNSMKNEKVVGVSLFQAFAASMLNSNSDAACAALISMVDHAIVSSPKTPKSIKKSISGISDLALTAMSKFGSKMTPGELSEISDKVQSVKSFDELTEQITLAFESIHSENPASSKKAISIEHVTEHIRMSCFDANFSLTALADHFKVNSSYLSRKFKSYVGVGISEYIQLLRCEQAKELLQNTDKSIPSIALNVGYYSAKSFSNTFKKATGMSPTRYKASVLENKPFQ